MVEALVAEAEKLVAEGIEARLAAADTGAAAEAEADRQALFASQGDDVNASEARVELIRKTIRTNGTAAPRPDRGHAAERLGAFTASAGGRA